MRQLKGNIVDIVEKRIFPGMIEIEEGKIISVSTIDEACSNYILPGLIDSHVHIESSMMIPSRFADMVVPRGTVAVVSDPHEIANVMGVSGVEYMINDAKKVPLKCFFGAPSCVPATDFETSGHRISYDDIEYLFKKEAWFLAEMMNFPGVINQNKDVLAKLNLAKKYNLPIDGHAPGLRGAELKAYVEGGISTDHECFSVEEALEKIQMGMKIQIREGSAARNFEALHSLISTHPNHTMLCTDDSHPDLIIEKGHIDRLMSLGLKKGYSIFEMYQAAVLNPVQHYKLPVGLLQKGDDADFIIVDNLDDFNVLSTYIKGKKVAENGKALFDLPPVNIVNNFNCAPIYEDDLRVIAPYNNPNIRVLEAEDGELLTGEFIHKLHLKKGEDVTSDIHNDLLKIVVINRYTKAKPVVGFIKKFKMKAGALASSVAHDSHNIVAVGCDDASLVRVINDVIDKKGGIAACSNDQIMALDLPIAGLMSDKKGEEVAAIYTNLNAFVGKMGCEMRAPFMTLAFMPLLVIPSLKIGDKGLFDVGTFSLTSLFVDDE